ncbi:universal stress protein [Maribacter hydrothermalis]|uniref:UspA domain-containing protein n=1 Tax=Maribacter hydrothermalis TaxID=1836467 RepID=A0A1B7YZ87_9FLAO|nr:universal stress protein [Maribacter hydrothermalis]APQ16045.1 hypothetical protein BTR34_01225 [Maribacter hydrothermalis]OBR35777.1 hypothetical protein A9200_11285 [Maribacter hydrothermalis]
MKNILIPTDFSIAAWNATKYALQLFEATNCTFYFLNTYTPELHSNRLMAGTGINGIQNSSAQLVSEKGLKKVIQQVKKEYKNPLHHYQSISSFSLFIEEVKETVEEYKIDFIIMSASGSSENVSIFMGRNTVRVLNAISNCPVIIIPKDGKVVRPWNIAFVADYNQFYSTEELNTIVQMAETLKCTVHVIEVQNEEGRMSELQRINQDMIDKSLAAISHSFHYLKPQESFSISLKQFINQANCQLLLMSNVTNSFINNLCRDFVVERSAFCSEIPLLIIQGVESNSMVNH